MASFGSCKLTVNLCYNINVVTTPDVFGYRAVHMFSMVLAWSILVVSSIIT